MDRRQPDAGSLRFDQRPQRGLASRELGQPDDPREPRGNHRDLPSLIATGKLALIVGEGEALPEPAPETGALVLEAVNEAWSMSQVLASEWIDFSEPVIDWSLAETA
jgi:hypothetical protein